MYTKSDNLQALQSQQMITDALLSLMKLYPYEEITITQICQEAKVVRQTFYRNFEFKIDILEFYLDNMLQKYISNYFYVPIDMYKQLKSFFDYLTQYKDFLLLIDKNNLIFLLNTTFAANIYKLTDVSDLIKAAEDPQLEVYIVDFVTSSICSIISIWIKNDFKESTEILANLSRKFFSGF